LEVISITNRAGGEKKTPGNKGKALKLHLPWQALKRSSSLGYFSMVLLTAGY